MDNIWKLAYVSYKREDIMWKCDAETDSSITWWCATNNYFYTAITCASQPASDSKLRLETNGWQLVFALMSWSALRSLNPFLQHWATDLYFAGFRSVLLNKPRALTGDYCRIYYTHLNWLLFTLNACIDLKIGTLTVIFHFKCTFSNYFENYQTIYFKQVRQNPAFHDVSHLKLAKLCWWEAGRSFL